MLVYASKLINTPILSLQAGTPIAYVSNVIIDPDNLKIIGFILGGPMMRHTDAKILDVQSVREYSKYGMVIDSIEELVAPGDVIKIEKALSYDFDLIGLRVETKKGHKLGKISDYTLTHEDFTVQQLIVQRPALKAFIDSDLVVPRSEITEVNDEKVIVKDEEKKIKEKAENAEFVPNFVNPFRKNPEPDYAPVQNQNPDEQDS